MDLSNKRKKALFFVSPFFGGASRMTITISKLLPNDEYEVVYVVFGKKIEEIRNFIPEGHKVRLLHIRNIFDFTTLKMIRLFRQERPSCVFSSFSFLNIRAIVAAKMAGRIKIIVRSDNNWDYFDKSIKFLLKKTYPKADVIIVQQEEMKDDFEREIPQIIGKTHVLHNIFDKSLIDQNLNAENPYQDNAKIRYIWSGRYQPTKGHDALIKAFDIVYSRITDAHLYILGKYDPQSVYFKSLVDYVQEKGLSANVHFVGFVTNPHVWIKYADCFVLPSRKEGLPNALVEAMYIGKPVVASVSVPIIDRMVREGYNGYKVKVDDIEEMADKMIKALDLKNFEMTYKPSSAEDYIKLFS